MKLKHSVLFLSLAGFVVAGSAFAAEKTAAGEKDVQKTLEKHAARHADHRATLVRHHNRIKALEEKKAPVPAPMASVLSDIKVSGGANVDGVFGNAGPGGTPTVAGTAKGERALNINGAFINVDGVLSPNASGRVGLTYSSLGDQKVNPRGDDNRLTVDQAYVDLHNAAGQDMSYSAVIGQQYMPFGSFNTADGMARPIISTFSQLLSEVNDIGVKGVVTNKLSANSSVMADAYVFQSKNNANVNTSENRVANFGADVGYMAKDVSGMDFNAVLGYLNDINSASSDITTVLGLTPDGNSGRIHAFSAFLSAAQTGNEGFDANIHAIRTLKKTNTSVPGVALNAILAVDAQVGYRFMAMNHKNRVYVGGGISSQGDQVSFGSNYANGALPKSQAVVGYDFDVTNNVTLGAAVAREATYATSSAPKRDYYLGLVRAAVRFG